MVNVRLPESDPAYRCLYNHIATYAKERGLSVQKVLEMLLGSIGSCPQLQVKFTEDLKNYLIKKETEIAETLQSNPAPTDRNKARFIIRTALCKYCSHPNRKKIKYKDVYDFLDYDNARTMRNYQHKGWEEELLEPQTKFVKERMIYVELCSELKQFAI